MDVNEYILRAYLLCAPATHPSRQLRVRATTMTRKIPCATSSTRLDPREKTVAPVNGILSRECLFDTEFARRLTHSEYVAALDNDDCPERVTWTLHMGSKYFRALAAPTSFTQLRVLDNDNDGGNESRYPEIRLQISCLRCLVRRRRHTLRSPRSA